MIDGSKNVILNFRVCMLLKSAITIGDIYDNCLKWVLFDLTNYRGAVDNMANDMFSYGRCCQLNLGPTLPRC